MRKASVIGAVILYLLLSSICAFAGEITVTKWSVDAESVLTIELHEQGKSWPPIREKQKKLGEDVFFSVQLPSGTLFLLPEGWMIDSVPGQAVGQGCSGELKSDGAGGTLIRFQAGDRVLFLNGSGHPIPLTARYRYFGHTRPSTTPLILAHYVTWFQTPEVSGRYSYRWTLRSEENGGSQKFFDPSKNFKGQACIASYNYPLTGPYDSSDPALIKYHLALMALSGIDGVIIDFYGFDKNNGEYEAFLKGLRALVKEVEAAGLKFAVLYEDQCLDRVRRDKGLEPHKKARDDFNRMEKELFSSPAYVLHDGRPVVFGFLSGSPDSEYVTLKTLALWEAAFSGLKKKPLFLPPCNVFSGSEGSYYWVTWSKKDDDFSGPRLKKRITEDFSRFFSNEKAKAYLAAGVFPAFNDRVFEEVGLNNGEHGIFRYDNGETFKLTFDEASRGNPNIIQLVTWNDYAEGTAIDPTVDRYDSYEKVDRGYTALEYVQDYKKRTSGLKFDRLDLRAPIELYRLMKSKRASETQKNLINKVYSAIFSGDADAFRKYAKEEVGINYDLSVRPILRDASEPDIPKPDIPKPGGELSGSSGGGGCSAGHGLSIVWIVSLSFLMNAVRRKGNKRS